MNVMHSCIAWMYSSCQTNDQQGSKIFQGGVACLARMSILWLMFCRQKLGRISTNLDMARPTVKPSFRPVFFLTNCSSTQTVTGTLLHKCTHPKPTRMAEEVISGHFLGQCGQNRNRVYRCQTNPHQSWQRNSQEEYYLPLKSGNYQMHMCICVVYIFYVQSSLRNWGWSINVPVLLPGRVSKMNSFGLLVVWPLLGGVQKRQNIFLKILQFATMRK